MRFDEPLMVIPLDEFDHNLVVIEQTIENVFTARLRDGVYDGRGGSVDEALMSLEEHLRDLAHRVRQEAAKMAQPVKSWNLLQMETMMKLYDDCEDGGTFEFEGAKYIKEETTKLIQMMGRTMRKGQ